MITEAESLGGVERLIEHPGIMTHASVPPEKRDALGISDSLTRLSVGVGHDAEIGANQDNFLCHAVRWSFQHESLLTWACDMS
jgi:cystathionine beta-lyase